MKDRTEDTASSRRPSRFGFVFLDSGCPLCVGFVGHSLSFLITLRCHEQPAFCRFDAIMSAHQHPLLSIDEDFDLRRLAPLSKRLRWRRPITSLAIGSSLTGVHGG